MTNAQQLVQLDDVSLDFVAGGTGNGDIPACPPAPCGETKAGLDLSLGLKLGLKLGLGLGVNLLGIEL